jgi:DNA polymerase
MTDLKPEFPDFFSGVEVKEEVYVPSSGPFSSKTVLIGEAPGENEVKEKKPFVGRAGKRLDDILSEIGVSRTELYVTNLVKERPPDNRDPKKEEIEKWKPLLKKEIDRIQPSTIVTLGNFATKSILNKDQGISKLHGKKYGYQGFTVIPAYHPAATLYNPSNRPKLKDDLRKAFGKKKSGQTTLNDLS